MATAASVSCGADDGRIGSSLQALQSVELCHATHSATTPFVRLSVAPAAVSAHLARHGDFLVSDAAARGFDESCQPSAAKSFDAFADYSTTSNPVGAWTYGYQFAGQPLVAYSKHDEVGPGITLWRDQTDPNVAKNTTGSDILLFGSILMPGADYLHFHPGPSGERSVVRWTAPGAGAASIAAAFRGLRNDYCGQTVDVYVLHNGTELFRGDIAYYYDQLSYSGEAKVAAGDTIDFAVGFGADGYVCDSTGLRATIVLK